MNPIERAARNRNVVGMIGVLLFILGFTATAWAAKTLWLHALVCGLAAYIAGMLVGFLFGVPRSVSQDGAKTDATTGGRLVAVNTNLEQISDWLTKIIVGVGLVELKQIPHYVIEAANFLRPFLGDTDSAAAFAAQILIYFWSFGFLSGYIATRVFLSLVISEADRAVTLPASEKDQVQQAATATVKLVASEPPPTPDVKTMVAAKTITGTPLATLTTPDDIAAWGQSQLLLGNYAQAGEAFRKALQLAPNDIKSHLGLGLSLYSTPSSPVTAAISELLAAEALITPQTDPAVIAQIYENLAAAYLYMPAPGGFQTSLQYASKALARPSADRARIYFYIAAANGQRYRWLKETNADEDRIKEAHDNAISAAAQAVQLDPAMRERLWELAQDPNALDNDLASLADDPEFRAVVTPGSGTT